MCEVKILLIHLVTFVLAIATFSTTPTKPHTYKKEDGHDKIFDINHSSVRTAVVLELF
jgi:hypothetical protein